MRRGQSHRKYLRDILALSEDEREIVLADEGLPIELLLRGNTLAHLREKKGMTQEVLAKTIGCDHSYISHLETGKAIATFPVATEIGKVLLT